MESILNSSVTNSVSEEFEVVIVDLGDGFSAIMERMNLLPEGAAFPDEEFIVRMILEASISRFYPAPQVLRAKVDNIFKSVDPAIKNEILACLITSSLYFIETFNKHNLWSNNGYAMYEFNGFLNSTSVMLRRINKLGPY